jgi:flagellar motor switch/type III secretory pathway protein FliN
MRRLLAEQGNISEAAEARTKWPMLLQVPVSMMVKIPLPRISLRGLAALSVGNLIVSSWAASEEVPLYASNVALSWGEFEVVDGMIAIRLTRLG